MEGFTVGQEEKKEEENKKEEDIFRKIRDKKIVDYF
jgi:hypothetical protein